MDSSRKHDCMTSFAVSAMLTSAIFATAPNSSLVTAATGPQPAALLQAIEGARAAGWADMQGTPAPQAVAAPASALQPIKKTEEPPLSQEQLRKLIKLIHGPSGHRITLDAPVASALGLSGNDATVTEASISDDDNPSDIQHYEMFELPRGEGYVITHGDARTVRIMKLGPDLKAVAAWRMPVNGQPVSIPSSDIPSLYASDMATWRRIADELGLA